MHNSTLTTRRELEEVADHPSAKRDFLGDTINFASAMGQDQAKNNYLRSRKSTTREASLACGGLWVITTWLNLMGEKFGWSLSHTVNTCPFLSPDLVPKLSWEDKPLFERSTRPSWMICFKMEEIQNVPTYLYHPYPKRNHKVRPVAK